MSEAPRIAVLISGGGRTLLNLADAIDEGRLRAVIALVVASRDCPGAARARRRGLAVEVMEGEIEAPALEALMRKHEVEWIVLAGYLKLVHIPARYRGRVVNIHPALLPDFGGPGMYAQRVHEAVLASGARQSGCTVHVCEGGYDRGPIVAQSRCSIEAGDTPESLAARVFALECELYPSALADLLEGRVQPTEAGVRMEGR